MRNEMVAHATVHRARLGFKASPGMRFHFCGCVNGHRSDSPAKKALNTQWKKN